MNLPSVDEFKKALDSMPKGVLDSILDRMEKDINSTSNDSEFRVLIDIDKL